MKKILIIATFLSLPLLSIGLFPVAAHAADVLNPVCDKYTDPNSPNTPTACKSNIANNSRDPEDSPLYGPTGILTKVIRLVSAVVGVAAVISIIVGGFKYVLANGDSNSINSAKNTILYAVVGLVISVLAQGIIIFVLNRL